MQRRSLAEGGGDRRAVRRGDTEESLSQQSAPRDCMSHYQTCLATGVYVILSFLLGRQGRDRGREVTVCSAEIKTPALGIVGFLPHSIISSWEDLSARSWMTAFPQLRARCWFYFCNLKPCLEGKGHLGGECAEASLGLAAAPWAWVGHGLDAQKRV